MHTARTAQPVAVTGRPVRRRLGHPGGLQQPQVGQPHKRPVQAPGLEAIDESGVKLGVKLTPPVRRTWPPKGPHAGAAPPLPAWQADLDVRHGGLPGRPGRRRAGQDDRDEPVAAWMGFDLLEVPTTPASSSACWTGWATSSASSSASSSAADLAKGHPGARGGTTPCPRPGSSSAGKDQFELALDPETARSYHDQTLTAPRPKAAHFCSICGPHFCAMKITQDARRYAEQRGLDPAAAIESPLQAKAAEFVDRGGRIYLPVAEQ